MYIYIYIIYTYIIYICCMYVLYICIYMYSILYMYYIYIPDVGLGVRVFANGPGDLGSIPGRVIPKTQKMVLDASLLNTQHYKVRIKGKVEQSREGVAPSPTHWCSSYRKGILRVTLDYGRQLYLLTLYIYNLYIIYVLYNTFIYHTPILYLFFLLYKISVYIFLSYILCIYTLYIYIYIYIYIYA